MGVISSFTLPPYNLFFLNFITYPLFFLSLCIFSKSNKTSFLIGFIFGFGYFFFSTYWISNSLTFEETFKLLIPFSLILLPIFFGLFYGFATLILFLLNLNKNLKSILLFSVTFSLMEYMRGTILTGFPWNLIVFSLSNSLSSIQILPYLGTYTLNLLTITIFLLPVIITFNINPKSKVISTFILFVILALNINFGSIQIKKFKEKEPTNLNIKINIVSPRIDINRYYSDEKPLERLNEIIKLSKSNKDDSGEIYIFPENILLGIDLSSLLNYKLIFKENFSNNDLIIMGVNSENNGEIYNSLILFDNNLNIISKYDKNKLVPFGEFLPFENFFSLIGLKKITRGYRSFYPSSKREIINLDKFKFLPLICYEIIYSGNLNLEKKRYDFIVNISEDGWFGDTIGPYQHFSHSIFRAIEEGKNILRSSNNGISGVVNPIGEIYKNKKTTDGSVIEVDALKFKETTYFSKYGNKIFFYFLIIYITLIFVLQRKDSK